METSGLIKNLFLIFALLFLNVTQAQETRQCQSGLCIGDIVFGATGTQEHGAYRARLVTIVGIESENKFTIRHEEAPYKGVVKMGWDRKYLAHRSGCVNHSQLPVPICVGDSVFFVVPETSGLNQYSARVMGVVNEGTPDFVLKFSSSPVPAFGYSISKIAVTQGCLPNSFCVGDVALNKSREGAQVIVKGLTLEGQLTLEYVSGPNKGAHGSGWGAKDLVKYVQVPEVSNEQLQSILKTTPAVQETKIDFSLLEQEFQLPERTPLTLPADLELKRRELGAAYGVGPRSSGVTCWVYARVADPIEDQIIGFRTSTIKSVKVIEEGRGVFLEFLDDPTLEGLRCFPDNKRLIQFRKRDELINIINENGFKIATPQKNRI